MVWKWRGRSWGKSTSNCVKNYGYNNLQLSRFVARVFSLKHFSIIMGNVGINSVGTESMYQKWQSSKIEYFTGASWKRLTCEILMKTSCLHSILTLRIPVIYRVHALLHGMLSRELPVKTLQSSMPWVFTLSFSYTSLTNKSHMKYKV